MVAGMVEVAKVEAKVVAETVEAKEAAAMVVEKEVAARVAATQVDQNRPRPNQSRLRWSLPRTRDDRAAAAVKW